MSAATKKILVTGGAGFIGRAVTVDLLAWGAEVRILGCLLPQVHGDKPAFQGSKDCDFRLGDLRNREAVEGALCGVDGIIHLAAGVGMGQSMYDICRYTEANNLRTAERNPEHTVLTSVVGTGHLLQLAQACDTRFLLTSTSVVYDDPLEHPQRETYRGNVNATGPRTCYEKGKRAAEIIVRKLAEVVANVAGVALWTNLRPLTIDDLFRRRSDISLAQRTLDWKPRLPLETGLRETIYWFAGTTKPIALVHTEEAVACRA